MTVSARRTGAQYLGVVAAVAVAATAIRWALRRCAARPDPHGPLVLWCDYGADPTWRFVNGGPRVAHVNMDSLGLTEATKNALRAWSQHFEEITCPPGADEPIDPIDSVWDLFVTEGERLRDRVAAEVGPNTEVVLDHNR